MEVEEAWKIKVTEKEDVKFVDAVILMDIAPPFQEICYGHIRQLALKCGLHTIKSKKKLVKNLSTITDGVDNLWDLKTSLEIYQLFWSSYYPFCSAEALSLYRFLPL